MYLLVWLTCVCCYVFYVCVCVVFHWPGVRYVIDSGLVKKRVFHAKTGLDYLTSMPISQAEAQQRAGNY